MFVPTTPVLKRVERLVIMEHVMTFQRILQAKLDDGWQVTHLAGGGERNYFCAILYREV